MKSVNVCVYVNYTIQVCAWWQVGGSGGVGENSETKWTKGRERERERDFIRQVIFSSSSLNSNNQQPTAQEHATESSKEREREGKGENKRGREQGAKR